MVQDGIERIDATYTAFLKQRNLRHFMNYFVEFQTGAVQYLLNPERIRDYLQIVKTKSGSEGDNMCQLVMQYVIVVLGKYLQIMVACHIFNEENDSVTEDFKDFNDVFEALMAVFKEVTGKDFKATDIPDVKSVLEARKSAANKYVVYCIRPFCEYYFKFSILT